MMLKYVWYIRDHSRVGFPLGRWWRPLRPAPLRFGHTAGESCWRVPNPPGDWSVED